METRWTTEELREEETFRKKLVWPGRGEQKSNGKKIEVLFEVTFDAETMNKDSPVVRSAREGWIG